MNWLDWGLLILAAFSLGSGIHHGFARAGAGWVTILFALVCAAWFCPGDSRGFIIVFVGVIAACAISTYFLGRWFHAAGLGWADRTLGGVFGLANAVLVWMVAVLALLAFAPKTSTEYVARSTLAPYAVEGARALSETVPPEMKSRVERTYNDLVQNLPARFRKAPPSVPRIEI